jgi:hypothetical protein
MALRSFTAIHNYLGVYTSTELPNVSGATVQSADVQVGDFAYDSTIGDLVVCTDATPGAAAYITTGSTSVGDASELIVSAQKGTAGTINVGEVVYITGWDNGAGVIEVELADASAAATMPGYGIARTSFTQAATGTLVVAGSLTGQDTATPEGGSWSVGDAVYVSETAGELTITKPTGTALIQSMGIVARIHASQGVIQVFGAGRTNDLPNLAQDMAWVGNASGVPTETAISSFGGGYIVHFGANIGAGDAGDYIEAWAEANGDMLGTLYQRTEITLDGDGTLTRIAWRSETGDNTTVLKTWINGVVDETITLTGQNGSKTISTSYSDGDRLGLEYDSGTAPGQTSILLRQA